MNEVTPSESEQMKTKWPVCWAGHFYIGNSSMVGAARLRVEGTVRFRLSGLRRFSMIRCSWWRAESATGSVAGQTAVALSGGSANAWVPPSAMLVALLSPAGLVQKQADIRPCR